jgi:MSHA biogenesis protein MshM
MSFLQYFGFREYPFQLTPNTDLFFSGGGHEEVFGALCYAISRGEGICKVTGEIGTGKTMLSRLLLTQLGDAYATAYLNAPQDDTDWLVRQVAREFEIPLGMGIDPYHEIHHFLIRQIERGRGALIVVDEAQALGPKGLEAIRLLSNIETGQRKLLQIVLFGQPELDQMLQRHELRQVNQRILFPFHTRPFSVAETMAYVRHRLEQALVTPGMAGDLFEPGALRLLAKASGGIPRLINILADKGLLAAYADGAGRVGKRHMRQAVRDSAQVLRSGGRMPLAARLPGWPDWLKLPPIAFRRTDAGTWLIIGAVLLLLAAAAVFFSIDPAGTHRH